MKAIKQINIEQAKVGQSLAEDLCDAGGTCLLREGEELSLAVLDRLRNDKIESITIWAEHILDEKEGAKLVQEITEQLAHRFRQVQDNASMRQLQEILLTYRLESLK